MVPTIQLVPEVREGPLVPALWLVPGVVLRMVPTIQLVPQVSLMSLTKVLAHQLHGLEPSGTMGGITGVDDTTGTICTGDATHGTMSDAYWVSTPSSKCLPMKLTRPYRCCR